ncbi:MAG: ACT domain-containing protein [archaeon]|jgi:predicted amino acid-binding ACT domain protein
MKGKTAEKEFLFISVIGKDKKGIVATISNYLYKKGVNIEDINQKVMEGYFVMTMVVDAKDSKQSIEKIREELEKIGTKMKVMISIRHENIFKMMHRI